MIEDIIKSIKAHLYDRTASPLFGAFVISWLLWNHRFIMAIVFGNGIQEKYDMMDKTINGAWSQCILFPLITALLYIFVYPYPARWIYGFSKRQQEKLNSIKNEIESNRLLTVEESRKLIAQHLRIENEFQATVDKLNSSISALSSEIESKDNIIDEQDKKILEYEQGIKSSSSKQTFLKATSMNNTQDNGSSPSKEEEINSKDQHNLDEDSIMFLTYIGDKGSVKLDNILIKFPHLKRVQCEYILNNLIEIEYISLSFYGFYSLTNRGTAFLVKTVLPTKSPTL